MVAVVVVVEVEGPAIGAAAEATADDNGECDCRRDLATAWTRGEDCLGEEAGT